MLDRPGSPLPTLLLVDDAPEQLLFLRGVLEPAGYRVLTATSGWEGLNLARTERPSLILLDQMMPGMDGKAVLRELQADPRTWDVPVIFLTILGGPEEIADTLNAGARDFLRKPFHAQELLARLRSHLERRQGRDREKRLIAELEAAQAKIRMLSEGHPMCAQCRGGLGPHGHGEHPRPAAEHAASPTPSREVPGARILIIDDDPMGLHGLIQYLRVDHKVLVASGGPEGLELAARERPELIILDVVMAGMDGHQVCRALKDDPRTREIPVIFITALDEEEDELAGFNLGAVDYIVKPFSLPVVHQRLATQLELKRCRDLLERQALVDALTGLPNRRHLQLSLDFLWRQAGRQQDPLSVIIMDVDLFKGYNDRYGHLAGDDCLKAMGACLDQVRRRATDILARFGGEEFICLVPSMPLQGAVQLAEAMREAVAALRLPIPGSDTPAQVTLSLGVATMVPCQGLEAAALLETADRALYAAKTAGRNRVVAAGG